MTYQILTKGKYCLPILIDEKDYTLVCSFKWYARKSGNRFYAARNSKVHKFQLMHTFLLGKKKGLVIDHINGNGLDNRRENLRHVTSSQNNYNKITLKERHSRFRGVYPCGKRWKSLLRVEGKLLHLGVFATEEDAARRFNKAVKEHNLDQFIKPNKI